MKKLLRNLLFVLLLTALLSACTTETDAPQNTSEPQDGAITSQDAPIGETSSILPQESATDTLSHNDETAIDPSDLRIYDPYWSLSDTDPFLFAMRDNPIDAQVDTIMEGRYTTGDMRDGLLIIYDLWEAELESSLQQLLDTIEKTELQQQLLESQTAWKTYVDTSLRVDERLVTQDGENYGTMMQLVTIDARMHKYRERTILLKYLFYLYSDGFYTGIIPQFLPVEP